MRMLCGTDPRNLLGASVVLAAGLIVTALASLYIKAGVEAAAQREFDFACNEIRLDITSRLAAGAQILRSGVALLDTMETVSRGEWHTFTRRLKIEQHLPGIQGIGFASLIPREQLDRHVQAIRGEGFPDYQVRPAGERDAYSAIIYLEPFEARNQRAFGYDMFSEPVRRAAMERARDANTAALSGKVILVQETDKDVQAGALMYVPVYRHGFPAETIEQRRTAILGWVYSPYRMTDLMRGTLRHWDEEQKGRQLSLQIYDGDVLNADALLYDSQGVEGNAPVATSKVTRRTPVDFAGHRWTLRFSLPGGSAALADYGSVWLVLFGGTISTFLLSGLMLWRQQSVRFFRERAEAGEALRSNEERFRIAAENLTDVVYEWDVKEKVAWYGDIDGITGYPPGGFARTISAWAAALHPEDKDRVMAALESHVKGVAPFNIEYRVRKLNGESRWWSARGTALRDDQGEPYKMIGSITDITERKRMEGALREQQKLAATGTLARGMAHEINNPIMVVMNYAELIKDQASGNATIIEFAEEILTGGRRMAKITQSLLGFTEQRGNPALETTRLEDLVAAVLPLAAGDAQVKGIALSCDIPADLPPVSCRRDQIEQVIAALLANAMEAWGEGPAGDRRPQAGDGAGGPPPDGAAREKKIVIRAVADCRLPIGGEDAARCDPQSKIKNQKSKIRLTVEDNGPGIPAIIQERLFDPFFTTKDRTRHSGLGLWISRSLAQEHGGELTFESETGHGTRFHMDLPAEDDRDLIGPLEDDCHEQNTGR